VSEVCRRKDEIATILVQRLSVFDSSAPQSECGPGQPPEPHKAWSALPGPSAFRGCAAGLPQSARTPWGVLAFRSLQVLMPAHRLRTSQSFLAEQPWSRCLLNASHECGQTRRLGAITLEGIAYLIRRAMLVQRAQDSSTLRLQTLCRMLGRGTRTIRASAVNNLCKAEDT